MDVELYHGGSDDDFSSVYYRGGKKAGKYTKTSGVWNYAPLDKELAPRYLDFKKIVKSKAKKAAPGIKMAGFIVLAILSSLPSICLILPGFLIRLAFGLIKIVFILIPCLCVRRLGRMIKKLRNKG
jgi:hypothetical protein